MRVGAGRWAGGDKAPGVSSAPSGRCEEEHFLWLPGAFIHLEKKAKIRTQDLASILCCLLE